MQGFCEVDLIEVGYVVRLNTVSRHLRQVERRLHFGRQKISFYLRRGSGASARPR